MTQTETQQRDGLQINDLVRDMNSYDNLWGRITDFHEDTALFAPLNGSEPYGVWVACLSKNAYHDHRILRG
jgi:hypothetical protein